MVDFILCLCILYCFTVYLCLCFVGYCCLCMCLFGSAITSVCGYCVCIAFAVLFVDLDLRIICYLMFVLWVQVCCLVFAYC